MVMLVLLWQCDGFGGLLLGGIFRRNCLLVVLLVVLVLLVVGGVGGVLVLGERVSMKKTKRER